MRVAFLGGGPAGLYLAISMKRRGPPLRVIVDERTRPGDTLGWNVVLSEETLQNLGANDPVSAKAIRDGHDLVRPLAEETAKEGITVNALCPDYADTPMTDRTIANIAARTGLSEAEARVHLERGNPMCRLGRWRAPSYGSPRTRPRW